MQMIELTLHKWKILLISWCVLSRKPYGFAGQLTSMGDIEGIIVFKPKKYFCNYKQKNENYFFPL